MRTEKKEGTIAIELDFSPILSIKEKQQRDAPSAARRRRHCSDFPFSRMNEHKKHDRGPENGSSVGWSFSSGNDGPNIPRNEHTGCPDTFLPNDRIGARKREDELALRERDRYVVAVAVLRRG